MRNNIGPMIIAIAFVAVIVGIFLLMGKSKKTATAAPAAAASSSTAGLQITDVRVGTGTVAKAGDTVTVSYVGSFPDGKVFDASANHGGSFSFVLGAGHVIKGWDEGVAGMRVGGERKLVVPPSLGYGSAGTPGGPIPPNATLDFTISLLKVQAP